MSVGTTSNEYGTTIRRPTGRFSGFRSGFAAAIAAAEVPYFRAIP